MIYADEMYCPVRISDCHLYLLRKQYREENEISFNSISTFSQLLVPEQYHSTRESETIIRGSYK